MRFLDTDSETFYTFLNPIIPGPITTGLLCLAGGIAYYSWNYYKNNKQEVKLKPIQKNDLEIKINAIEKEGFTIIKNDIEPIPLQELSSIKNNIESVEKQEFDMLDDAIEAMQKDEFDMLDDAENEFKTVANNDNHWVMIEMPSSSSNHL